MRYPSAAAVTAAVIRNTYAFIDKHIDASLPKEHLGYIVDRVGYEAFKECALQGVTLGKKARVAQTLEFAGYSYDRHCNLGPANGHEHAREHTKTPGATA